MKKIVKGSFNWAFFGGIMVLIVFFLLSMYINKEWFSYLSLIAAIIGYYAAIQVEKWQIRNYNYIFCGQCKKTSLARKGTKITGEKCPHCQSNKLKWLEK